MNTWFWVLFALLVLGSTFSYRLPGHPQTLLSNFLQALIAWSTVGLLLVTWMYVGATREMIGEMGKSRQAIEESSVQSLSLTREMVEEMRETRKQQARPEVYVWFAYDSNEGHFFTVARNFGGGIAKDVRYSYAYDGGVIERSYLVLGPGQEVATRSVFAVSSLREEQENVDISVSYLDTFGEKYEKVIPQNLRDMANQPLPSVFMKERSERARESDEAFRKAVIESGGNLSRRKPEGEN